MLTLDLGLRRAFSWPFIIGDVRDAILGADFLIHSGLLLDMQHRRLVATQVRCAQLPCTASRRTGSPTARYSPGEATTDYWWSSRTSLDPEVSTPCCRERRCITPSTLRDRLSTSVPDDSTASDFTPHRTFSQTCRTRESCDPLPASGPALCTWSTGKKENIAPPVTIDASTPSPSRIATRSPSSRTSSTNATAHHGGILHHRPGKGRLSGAHGEVRHLQDGHLYAVWDVRIHAHAARPAQRNADLSALHGCAVEGTALRTLLLGRYHRHLTQPPGVPAASSYLVSGFAARGFRPAQG